jgi:hypothetical protein
MRTGKKPTVDREITVASTSMQQVVERAVAQALENHTPQLRDELVRRVVEGVQPQLEKGEAGASSENGASGLLNAVLSIHAGTNQKEILRALLDAAVPYSGRSALFVIKSGAATGWQGRGFGDDDNIKDFALDVSHGAAERALQSRTPAAGSAAEMAAEFISKVGAPAQDQVLLLPLRLKDKVAALVYADAGPDPNGKMDAPALELLVAATSAWLEVVSLRKQAHKEGASESDTSAVPVVAQAVSSYSDPFAGHAPAYAVASAPVEEAPMTVATAGAAAAVAPALDSLAQMSPQDADIHRKAQRFARLLMDEIKLYNQAKVTEGRKHKDLYDRLKEDIEKSRATYQKRYGSTVASSADYFQQELIRSLAEDDVSVMGANFRG